MGHKISAYNQQRIYEYENPRQYKGIEIRANIKDEDIDSILYKCKIKSLDSIWGIGYPLYNYHLAKSGKIDSLKENKIGVWAKSDSSLFNFLYLIYQKTNNQWNFIGQTRWHWDFDLRIKNKKIKQ
jgi:hypothetical protein